MMEIHATEGSRRRREKTRVDVDSTRDGDRSEETGERHVELKSAAGEMVMRDWLNGRTREENMNMYEPRGGK